MHFLLVIGDELKIQKTIIEYVLLVYLLITKNAFILNLKIILNMCKKFKNWMGT